LAPEPYHRYESSPLDDDSEEICKDDDDGDEESEDYDRDD
jgi:hypothetical protein